MAFPENREIRRFLRFVLFNLVICTAAYLMLVANELTNTYDGLWSGSDYRNYAWTVEIGRWFWPVIGKARMNISPEPFTSILSLFLYVLGGCLVAFRFGLKDSLKGYLLVLASVINTAVCSALSYRYMSPTFALAYLLSVTAALALCKEKLPAWLASAVCLILALGLYQANIGCACVLALINLIRLLQNGAETKKIIRFITGTLAALLCSFVVYKIIWDCSLKLWHVEASSYRGGGEASVSRILMSLPQSLKYTYTEFYRFFFENDLKHNVYQRLTAFHMLIVLLAMLMLILIVKNMKRRTAGTIFLTTLCFLLIPPAANVAMILAVDPGGTSIQMTMPMITALPFLLCVTENGESAVPDERHTLRSGVMSGICSLCLLVMLFGSFLMISIDQHVMLRSRENAVNMLNRIAVELGEDTNPEGGVFFVGRPSDNPVFLKDQLWERSNAYAHYGEFWLGGGLTTQSYFGYLRDAGLMLTFNWDEACWDDMLNREEVRTMPVYPDDGYMMRVGNSMVVRFS